jgi:hypothetical protein
VMGLTIRDGRITEMYVLSDPERIRRLDPLPAAPPAPDPERHPR